MQSTAIERPTRKDDRSDGTIVGTLLQVGEAGSILVSFQTDETLVVEARTTVTLIDADVGAQVVAVLEGGDPTRPIVIGKITQAPIEQRMRGIVAHPKSNDEPHRDDDVLEIRAKRKVVIKCGKSSITLTEAGKVIIKGEYLLSRSTGVNRIRGGSVQLN